MNRPRKHKGPYPPCFYPKHGAYYLVKANKWTRLGTDLGLALAEYARLMETARVGGMPALIDSALSLITPGLAKTTRTQYAGAAEVLKRKLRQFEPHEVKGRHVAAIMESLASTPNMANRILSVLRQVFDYAVKRQLIDDNPCNRIPRHHEAKRTRLLSDDEWQAIHAKAGPRLRVIMELQYLTGQRIGDVLSIRRSQLTDEGITFEQQKTGARLLVRWSPDLRAAVAAANALSSVQALTLLRGRDGGPPDYRSVAAQWAKACEAAGVKDARLNDGRAMSATAARRQGQDAQALLGHTSAAMTARYLRERGTPEVSGPTIPSKPKSIRRR